MAILERTISMIAQWAKNATTTIPTNKIENTPYRNNSLTVAQAETGQGYAAQIDSPNYNQRDWLITGLLMQIEKCGLLPYSKLTNYEQNAYTLGTNGIIYQALLPSGPNNGGVRALTDTGYWKNFSGTISDHINNKSNPHGVTAAQVGASASNHTHTLASLGINDTMAPRPQNTTGVGQWRTIYAEGSNLALPSGGTWAYYVLTSGNQINSPSTFRAGTAAGGTITDTPGVGRVFGFAWRVA